MREQGRGTGAARAIPVIVLVVLAFGIYAPVLRHPFVWLDSQLVARAARISGLRSALGVFSPNYWAKEFPTHPRYRPVRVLSLILNHAVSGTNPWSYYLLNVLVHCCNVALLYALTARLLGSQRMAVLAALLFAVHPIHVEAIDWMKNRSDLLCTMFCLAALLLHVLNFGHSGGRARRLSLGLILCSLACFLLGLLSKEMAVALAPVMLLFAAFYVPRIERGRAYLASIPFIVVGCLYLLFVARYVKESAFFSEEPEYAALGLGRWSPLVTIAFYVRLLLLPTQLSADWDFPASASLADTPVQLALGTLAAVIALALLLRRSRSVLFSLGWILCFLLPVSNLISMPQRPLADQRLYLPSVGFCLLLARAAHKRRAATAWLVLVCGLYGLGTWSRHGVWEGEHRLWRDTVLKSPANPRARYNLGTVCGREGRLDEAITQLREAVRLDPLYGEAHYNLGAALERKKVLGEAIRHYRRATEVSPRDADSHLALARLLVRTERFGHARVSYEEALRIDSQRAEALKELGLLLFAASDHPASAYEYLSRAIQVDPTIAHEPEVRAALRTLEQR